MTPFAAAAACGRVVWPVTPAGRRRTYRVRAILTEGNVASAITAVTADAALRARVLNEWGGSPLDGEPVKSGPGLAGKPSPEPAHPAARPVCPPPGVRAGRAHLPGPTPRTPRPPQTAGSPPGAGDTLPRAERRKTSLRLPGP